MRELNQLSEAKLIFKGSATEGAKAFPANVNVAAAVGLAGVGAKKTQLEIWADPGLSKNTHTILVKSDSSNFKIEIENIQSEENPGQIASTFFFPSLGRFSKVLSV